MEHDVRAEDDDLAAGQVDADAGVAVVGLGRNGRPDTAFRTDGCWATTASRKPHVAMIPVFTPLRSMSTVVATVAPRPK
ncbi:hypothetical protein ACFWOJ_23160 [Streptomyces sp. NPDC058439]|uniref:hypothetical protein n=1 Tax=Streptomyces sp. NPDC058439 TaxID=3346500 RepID=UPI0036468CBA